MEVIHDPEDLRFYLPLAEEAAELTYNYLDDKVLDFDYTYVPENARNQGLADQLVRAGLEYAREKHCQVVPSCPVVEAYVRRHPEYQELIRPDNG